MGSPLPSRQQIILLSESISYDHSWYQVSSIGFPGNTLRMEHCAQNIFWGMFSEETTVRKQKKVEPHRGRRWSMWGYRWTWADSMVSLRAGWPFRVAPDWSRGTDPWIPTEAKLQFQVTFWEEMWSRVRQFSAKEGKSQWGGQLWAITSRFPQDLGWQTSAQRRGSWKSFIGHIIHILSTLQPCATKSFNPDFFPASRRTVFFSWTKRN